jgi:hypothetical protein
VQVNVLQDVSRIDPMLDPNHVYEQVFAQAAGRHGVLDLLCVTRARRLAILELKATENIDLPLQAADYWSRIRRHQAHGDIARYGYFPGIDLQPVPIVYIIAPALRFHPTTDSLLDHITPEMEISVLGCRRAGAGASVSSYAKKLQNNFTPFTLSSVHLGVESHRPLGSRSLP